MSYFIGFIIIVLVLLYLRSKLFSPFDNSKLEELDGDGSYSFDIVGEASYQANLEKIVGARDEKGARLKKQAIVWLENDNEYDKKAVCVDIDNKTVGYFSKADAKAFRKYIKSEGIKGDEWKVDAIIIGGKKRDDEWLNYGVKLDLEINDD